MQLEPVYIENCVKIMLSVIVSVKRILHVKNCSFPTSIQGDRSCGLINVNNRLFNITLVVAAGFKLLT